MIQGNDTTFKVSNLHDWEKDITAYSVVNFDTHIDFDQIIYDLQNNDYGLCSLPYSFKYVKDQIEFSSLFSKEIVPCVLIINMEHESDYRKIVLSMRHTEFKSSLFIQWSGFSENIHNDNIKANVNNDYSFLGTVERMVTKTVDPSRLTMEIDYYHTAIQTIIDLYCNNSRKPLPTSKKTNNSSEKTPKEWQCPNCKKKNPIYVTSCSCGCTIQDAREDEKNRNEAKEIIKKMEKTASQMLNEEIEQILSSLKQYDLTQMEEYAVRVIIKEPGQRINELCRRIPRSTNPKDFKYAIDNLLELEIIKKDDEEKYYYIKNETVKEEAFIDDNVCNYLETADNQFVDSVKSDTHKPIMDKYDEIRKCKELLDEGIISVEEFERKKKELLGI